VLASRDGYEIDDDPARLDLEVVYRFLSEQSYWAKGRSRETVERAVAGSLNFGLYQGTAQVGFTRVVTDQATFAWVCDVFVLPEHRGRRLGHWLIETMLAHPGLQGLRRLLLATADAHGVYADAGFAPLREPWKWMERGTALNPGNP
jgi:GNAT superfamily N-acetyltransferase